MEFSFFAGTAFLSLGLLFGAMALYGAVSRRSVIDPQALGLMGGGGVFVATSVNWALGMSWLELAVSCLTVLLVVVLMPIAVRRVRRLTGRRSPPKGRLEIFGAMAICAGPMIRWLRF